MIETMLTYVNEEPEILKRILEEFDESNILNNLPKQVEHVLILATGSSLNAALAAKYYMESTAAINVTIEEPFNYEHYGTFDKKIDLILAISQSGKSTSTINVLNKVIKRKVPIMALTNDLETPLVELSQVGIDLNVGEEKVGYVTKGYSGTILNLFLIACTIGKNKGIIDESNLKERIKELENTIKEIPELINRSISYFNENKDRFSSYSRFLCIGYGANVGVAKEFETKFTETVRLPSSGCELEAYMHGPFLEANKEHALLFLVDDSPISSRAFHLRNYMNDYVGTTMTIVKNETVGQYDFSLQSNCTNNFIMPLLYVVLVQIWSYLTAEMSGIDLNIDPFPDFDEKLNSKLI
ncbi:SIS domain-containing protein [Marinilactibacillus psychrotolerans]|uniref:SIS domain-containing protein n=1 Tax=Marinilactibacillus psychrotolerans TaxID=191770 RepID=A0A5R9C2M0_9LACT|nr:SIS domain-containing protein [Marinilactibacillus psychrotolerans]TLQ06945.1 SIS domain-containing protein [Marinilactibacillus psychrotolerans]